jgi:hypothetical protein
LKKIDAIHPGAVQVVLCNLSSPIGTDHHHRHTDPRYVRHAAQPEYPGLVMRAEVTIERSRATMSQGRPRVVDVGGPIGRRYWPPNDARRSAEIDDAQAVEQSAHHLLQPDPIDLRFRLGTRQDGSGYARAPAGIGDGRY